MPRGRFTVRFLQPSLKMLLPEKGRDQLIFHATRAAAATALTLSRKSAFYKSPRSQSTRRFIDGEQPYTGGVKSKFCSDVIGALVKRAGESSPFAATEVRRDGSLAHPTRYFLVCQDVMNVVSYAPMSSPACITLWECLVLTMRTQLLRTYCSGSRSKYLEQVHFCQDCDR